MDLKVLVEETYMLNGNVPITFIVHSMGGPMTLLFLQQMDASWKDKYVARMISLAGAWAGSVKAIKVFAIGKHCEVCNLYFNLNHYCFCFLSGDDLGSFALSGKVLRSEQITSPSLAWLLPSPLFWKKDEILVRTTNRTYTMEQLEEFFR